MVTTQITWNGHASITIRQNDVNILVDPWIQGNPACTSCLEDISQADCVCVTHGHIDHLGDALQIVKMIQAPLVSTPEIALYAHRHGLPYKGELSLPLNIGGSWETEKFCITMVNALHTSDVMGQEWKEQGLAMTGSGAVGYIISFPAGPVVYCAGDTGVFGDMAIIRQLYGPTISILPIGGKFNMGYREGAYAASLLESNFVLPVHHGAFPDQALDIEKLTQHTLVRAPRSTVVDWKAGDTFEHVYQGESFQIINQAQ